MSGASLPKDLLARILESYGIPSFQLRSVRGGYRNISHHVSSRVGEVNVMLLKHEPCIVERIDHVDALAEHVWRAGVPVRTRYDKRIMRLHGRSDRYIVLYHYLSGETIPWEAYTMKHIKLLGWALAEFHHAAQSYTGELPSVIKEYRTLATRMMGYFVRDDVRTAVADKCHLMIDTAVVDSFLKLVDACTDLPDQQALHMDFVRGNILFGDGSDSRFRIGDIALTGIIDLEKAAHGPLIFDIARTLAFLYVDTIKSADKVYKYFMHSGYIKRGKGRSDDVSLSLLDDLVTLMLSYDLYKFMRDNPYESLVHNHHFRRTRDILIERKVLYYTH
ncbi:MAG: phosphotransferase [Candidatus Saccharimonadales bacterium]